MEHNPLKTELMGVTLNNPVIAASGTFGFGEEYEKYIDVSRLGGISGKGLTLHDSPGNDGTRVYETYAGILNSIGLENPGVKTFVAQKAGIMRRLGPAVIANLGGHCIDDYLQGAELLNDADIDILELNISCPNVRSGGMSFGVDACAASKLVTGVKRVSKHPLLVKLTPNAGDIAAVAQACEDAGADGVCLINTLLGMAIDVDKRKIVFDNVYAGLSGPAIMPIALRMVHSVAKKVKIPIVGVGGITTARDALAFIMAGAVAIEVGTATFAKVTAMTDIIDGLNDYCIKNKLSNIAQIRGIL